MVQDFSENKKFDLIGMFNVLEHIAPQDLPGLFQSLKKQLKPGASLVLTVPALMSLWSEFDVDAKHFKRFTVEDFTELVEENGFKVYYCSYFMFFVLPFVYIQRWLMNVNKSSVKSGAIKNPSKLNFIFASLCFLERQALKFFSKLPLGSSLICLAKASD